MQENKLLQNTEKQPILDGVVENVQKRPEVSQTGLDYCPIPIVENKKTETNVKWKFLEHNGPLFPPLYDPLPENVKFYYKGQALKLSPLTEEFASIYSKGLCNHHPDFKIPEIFNRNFMEGWQKIMTEEERKIIISLDDCNFTEIKEYFTRIFLEKKSNPNEKKAENKKNVQLMISHGFCVIDGQKFNLVKFKITPPALYRHRDTNPNIGKLRHRIMPEDIIINCR